MRKIADLSDVNEKYEKIVQVMEKNAE